MSPLLRENGRTPAAYIGDVNSLSGILLAFHLNQVIQPLFSTEFSSRAILILLLFISLIKEYSSPL